MKWTSYRWCALMAVLIFAPGCRTGETASAPNTLDGMTAGENEATTSGKARDPQGGKLIRPLFNGRDLSGWRVAAEACFDKHGKVYVSDGVIAIEAGSPMSGIAWRGEFPTNNYEVSLEATRVAGDDFFCGMTFPVGDSWGTLIVGGWGGMVVGLSNVDGMNAAENQTTRGMRFETGRWYAIRLRVTDGAIEVWIDGEQEIQQKREGHRFDIWWEQEPAKPFGINTWYTHGALRNIVLEMLL